LPYSGETGALNKHISDAFGIMARHFTLGLTGTESDWLIGAGLFTDKVKGKAVRSMAAPGTAYDDPILGRDWQPAHMRDYVRTIEDNGGVHINSGIPNHAFYLAVTAIGRDSWEVAGKIWYEALIKKLRQSAKFADMARATIETAGELFGIGGNVQRIITGAWETVGVPTSKTKATRSGVQASGRRSGAIVRRSNHQPSTVTGVPRDACAHERISS
jgi:Zn-dependent metalloprotease